MNTRRAAVLMSIRSRHARDILTGEKTVELRRRIPSNLDEYPIFVYSSGQDKAVTMKLRVSHVVSGPPAEIWSKFKETVCISEGEFFRYYSGAPVAYALVLKDIKPIDNPIQLSSLREEFGINAPQSWRYVANSVAARMDPGRTGANRT